LRTEKTQLEKRAQELEVRLGEAERGREEQGKRAQELEVRLGEAERGREEQGKRAQELEVRLGEAERGREEQGKRAQELEARQSLFNEELAKAEGQIELIKDLLLRDNARL
jgi:chromosome segregation ATPase